VPLRYKRIDLQEPLKKDVIAYLEAVRLGKPLPRKPPRLLFSYFHRLDSGVFHKALLNADSQSVIYMKELPAHVQVSSSFLSPFPQSACFDS
jgi:primary-amine oxidase